MTTAQKTIADVLDNVVKIQKSIEITAPHGRKIVDALPYPLAMSRALPATPMFLNFWTFDTEGRHIALGIETYTITMQLFHYLADLSIAAEELTAFHEQVVTKFGSYVTLNGAATNATLRGAQPTLGSQTRAGREYLVLDYLLDVQLYNTRVYTALTDM